MRDPVTAADGQTYDRCCINQWFRINSTSPMSRAAIADMPLYPNRAVLDAITEWVAAHPKSSGKLPPHMHVYLLFSAHLSGSRVEGTK